jgi:DNA repair protein RadA/Sms
MARTAVRYVCQSCAAAFPKWNGRCENCGSWNSLAEEADVGAVPGAKTSARGGRVIALESVAGSSPPPPRLLTDIAEFDRVCGGGLVPGSALLVGGDPGIGKSTLLLQAMTALAKSGKAAVYISGEEGVDQTRERLAQTHAPSLRAGVARNSSSGRGSGSQVRNAGERAAPGWPATRRRHVPPVA